MKTRILFIFALLLQTPSTWAKFETTIIEKSFRTSAKIVIDEEQIKNSKAANVGILLATEANIAISNSAFQPNSLFIRGGDSGQVLILVDGLPVYDPSTVQRSFNLNSLSVQGIKKITIIKGSQSVWYGGQALSAVIKIETLPTGNDKWLSMQLATGTDATADISKAHGDRLSSIGLQNQFMENHYLFFKGDLQQQEQSSPVLDSDFKYKKRKGNWELGYLHFDESKFYIKASQYSDRNENVTGVSFMDFAALDTVDFITMNDSQQVVASYSDSTVSLKPLLTVGFVQTHRQFNYGLSSYNTTEENQEYKGSIIPVRGELRLLNYQTFRWDMGASYQKETMLYEEFRQQHSNSSNEMNGVFTKMEYDLNSDIMVNAGVRNDSDKFYSGVNTYQVGLNYQNLKLEHATGYRLPSLYHLYSNKGNANLNPEFARTYSLNGDFSLAENFKSSITLFETHIENQIAAKGNPLQYYNIGRTKTQGVETSFAYLLDEFDVLKLSLAYQEPKDVNSGKWLSKRPLQSGSLSFIKKMPRANWTLEIVGRGDRLDYKNSSQTVTLPSFGLVNTSYIFIVDQNWDMFIRGNNLLNQTYQETYGYYNRGTDFQAGIDLQF